MPRKSFSGAAVETKLTALISSAATTIAVTAISHWPNTSVGTFVVTIDRGNGTKEEKVLVASYTGNVLTVATNGRGYDTTTAQQHTVGASIVPTFDATTITKHETFVAAVGTVTPSTSAIGDAAVDGTSGKPADASHKHARESFATGASSTEAITSTKSDGSSASPARADHRHGMPGWGSGATTTSHPGDSTSTGSSSHPARADHKHGRETSTGGGSVVPVGGVIEWYGTTAPTTYLFLHGAKVSKGTWPKLASAYPSWVTGTTIKLPDTRTKFTMGAGGGHTPGQTGGSANVSLTTSNIPKFTVNVSVTDPGHKHGGTGTGANSVLTFVGSGGNVGTTRSSTTARGEQTATATTGISGKVSFGQATPTKVTTTPPFIAAHKIVRAN